MKTLELEEMENIQGGIKCSEIEAVIDHLYDTGNWEQGHIVLGLYLGKQIQCT